ncbi:MAG: DUF1549 domain-containing protein, partial [Chthoniobacteraceae bacterium]
MRPRSIPAIAIFVLLISAAPIRAADQLPPPTDHPVDFVKDVQPLFVRSCAKCHGTEKQKGELRLDLKAHALKGGASGAVIVPGSSAESPLIVAVSGIDEDLVMPEKGRRLTAEEVGVLRRWIDDGAAWPEDGSSIDDPLKTHWSFKPLSHSDPPPMDGDDRNPIDAFIAAKLAEKHLALSTEADRRTLIRRVYFDVIGLPPPPGEVENFVTDPDPRAYENLVDRLLASPRYGERWARHWLDVVRFAESDGFETNQPRPNAWPYRDYVIRAFNNDLPYDQFIREQLAGDAFGVDEATGFLVGGAYDKVKSPDPVLTANQRGDELHDMIGTTSATFLALTVNCARCHNHKFDPIPQTDYYALKAVFAGVRHGERELRPADFAERQRRADAARAELEPILARLGQLAPLSHPNSSSLQSVRSQVTRGENIDRFEPVEARFVRFTIRATTDAEPCLDELEIFSFDGRNVARDAKLASSGNYAGNPAHKLEHLTDGLYGNEHSWISNERGKGWVQLEFSTPQTIESVRWSRDRAPQPRFEDRVATNYDIAVSFDGETWRIVADSTDRLGRGESPAAASVAMRAGLSPNEQVESETLSKRRAELEAEIEAATAGAKVYAGALGNPEETFVFNRGDSMQLREKIAPGGLSRFPGAWKLPMDATDQDRRLALAKWITAPENPLAARVMVNRLWHYHFGRGLADTPSDFGLNGSEPSHPELLDWLAGEFIARGWSVKAMQRLLLTSATYRQSSDANSVGLAADADDHLFWRFPPRRLEAESLRDSILAASGQLDLRMGGPGFDLFDPNTNYVKVYATKTKFEPGDFRRMVYQSKPRAELDDIFGTFDCPDAGQSQPKRTVSTTPLQALNLMNSAFLLEQSGFLA